MNIREWLPSDGSRVQLRVRDLADGSIEVRGWASTATYATGEFNYDRVRDELHLPDSLGHKLIRQPYRH